MLGFRIGFQVQGLEHAPAPINVEAKKAPYIGCCSTTQIIGFKGLNNIHIVVSEPYSPIIWVLTPLRFNSGVYQTPLFRGRGRVQDLGLQDRRLRLLQYWNKFTAPGLYYGPGLVCGGLYAVKNWTGVAQVFQIGR